MKNLTKIEAYVVVFRCSSCWETTERMQACVSQWLTITVCFSFWDCCEKIGFMKQKTNLTLKILAKRKGSFSNFVFLRVFCCFSHNSNSQEVPSRKFLGPYKIFFIIKKMEFCPDFFYYQILFNNSVSLVCIIVIFL